MNEATRDLFYLLGEVSIATVALTGIIMVLLAGVRPGQVAGGSQIAMQLRMSTTVTIFSVMPLVAEHLGLQGAWLWRVVSGCYLTTISYFLVRTWFTTDVSFRMADGARRAMTVVTGLSGVALLGGNLYFARSEPHVLQLFVAWVVSLLLFRSFIVEALTPREAVA